PAGDPNGLRLTAARGLITLAGTQTRVALVNLSDELSERNGLAKPDPLHTGVVQPLTRLTPDGKAQLLTALGAMKTTDQAGLDDGFTFMSQALDLSGRVLANSAAKQRFIFL